MSRPLTLSEFRLTRRTLPLDRLADALGDTGETFHDGATSGLLMDRHLFILRLGSGDFYTESYGDSIEGDLPTVEAWLYFEHYASESVEPGAWDRDGLTRLLADYCGFHSLPSASAGDLLETVEGVHDGFLSWFVREWEEVESGEDAIEAAVADHIRAAAALRFTVEECEDAQRAWTTEALTELHGDFCRFYGLTQRPARDMLTTAQAAGSEHTAFLTWLAEAFEEAEALAALAEAEVMFRRNPAHWEG